MSPGDYDLFYYLRVVKPDGTVEIREIRIPVESMPERAIEGANLNTKLQLRLTQTKEYRFVVICR